MKLNFARHRVRITVILGGGTQFTSKQFLSFSTYDQSTGMTERQIQRAKKIFKKVLEDSKDLDLALPYFRNTTSF